MVAVNRKCYQFSDCLLEEMLGFQITLHDWFREASQYFLFYWASEASPTLGCSIKISRDIYIAYYMSKSGIWLVIS